MRQSLSLWCLLILVGVAALGAVDFRVTYLDNPPLNDFAARGWLEPDSLFQRNVDAALKLWSERLVGDATLELQVEATRAVARSGGTFTNGRFLGTTADGLGLFEPGPLSVILTGNNPGGPPDALMLINSAFLDRHYWLDPTPENRDDERVPPRRTDLVSIVLHEIGHALGMAGTRQFAAGMSYGRHPAGFINPIDNLSYFGGDGNPLAPSGAPNPMFYGGARARQVYALGGDVPLSHVGPGQALHSQDFYHLGTCSSPAVLTGALMNGCSVPIDGSRLSITALDLAVLEDLGYPRADRCAPSGESLCLNRGRFEVEVEWRDFANRRGRGHVVPFGSDDSGLFWFFSANNWEMLVKVLDGCEQNDHFWVFAAATTNVEYRLRVTDSMTGAVKEYFNPLGNAALALTDTAGFASCDLSSASATLTQLRLDDLPESVMTEARWSTPTAAARASAACSASDQSLCLNQQRFEVEVEWRDFANRRGSGRVVPFGSDDSGLFWFFDANNWEMLVKVLKGCGRNKHFWVFAAATTNVEYTLRVTDSMTGAAKEYFNPLGSAASALTDTSAFASCLDRRQHETGRARAE